MSGTKENNETAKQTTNSSEDQNNLNKTGNVDETKITANEQAIRTHTKTIDLNPSTKSTDVGVQATPAAVAADLGTHKTHRGILPVTSDMRNSVTTEIHSRDNRQHTNNYKEKTPMCLINELARYNKVEHKYVLVDEKGPAHKKEFHIRLDLGEEGHRGLGTSIKRAQHAAAETALNSTKLKRPVYRPGRPALPPASVDKKKSAVTPTVELNALAMKLGQHPEYINTEAPHQQRFNNPYMPPPHYGLYRPAIPPFSLYHQTQYVPPHYRPRLPRSYHVLLKIDKREFKGEGATRQQAKHNAAQKALKVMKNTPPQQKHQSSNLINDKAKPTSEDSTPVEKESSTPANETTSACTGTSEENSELLATDDSTALSPGTSLSSNGSCSSDDGSDGKSEISKVHELALQHSLTITFEVIHQSGPPHLRNFLTRCVCGEYDTEGEGNSKKKSKKRAAELMLRKLQTLNLSSAISKQKVKNIANKKKNRNLIKMQKANLEYGSGINPISRLIQIQQANRRREPMYSLVMEQGLPRRREFVIQVECNDQACNGKGPNKKLAKRNAAEEMLQMMGYSKPSPAPGKSVLKSPDHSSSHHNKHVTFMDSAANMSKPPGVLVRPDISPKTPTQEMPQFKAELAASLAKELLDTGKSAVGETLLPSMEHPKSPLQSPTEKLEYLGSCMGFAVEFTDFPKGTNTEMFMTLIALQTNPPQSYHGSASTVEESRNKASLQALKQLSLSSTQHDDSVEEITPPRPETPVQDTKNEPEVKGEPCPVADIGSGDHADVQTSESPLTNGETKDATIEKNNVKTEKTPAKEELTANDDQKVEASENSQALS